MKKLSDECQLIVKHILTRNTEYNMAQKPANQISMTISRLQKILYFSQIEYIKHTGNIMFEDDFYATSKGPGIKEVHNYYIDYATGRMDTLKFPSGTISKDKQIIIDIILENTNSIDTDVLTKYSCKIDNLWINAYNNEDNRFISKSNLIKYYKPNNKPKTKKRTKRETRYYKQNTVK